MESIRNKTVADYVTQNIHTANIFKKYNINFCCKAKISIKKACDKNGVDYYKLVKDLNNFKEKTTFLTNFNNWELDFLMIFIVHKHHVYVRKNIPILKRNSQRVVKIYGNHFKELIEINQLILQFSEELTKHLKEEENNVFPLIKNLIVLKKEYKNINYNCFTIQKPIKLMEEKHEKANNIFKRISTLTNNYNAPENTNIHIKKLYEKLEEFEDNLQHHIHLENNILFPKAKKLEVEVLKK